MKLSFPLAFVLCTAFFTGNAISGEIETRVVTAVKTSVQVFKTGVANQDALLLIAAAKIRKQAGLSAIERSPDGQNTNGNTDDFLSWEKMLDAAEALAVGDKSLLGIIEDVRAENSKGVVDGPVYSIIGIKSGGTDTYASLPFEGGKYAEIYIEGNGRSDLNLFVYDDQNRLVCSDTDISDIAYCGWRPVASAAFKVTVKNRGKARNQYSLITN